MDAYTTPSMSEVSSVFTAVGLGHHVHGDATHRFPIKTLRLLEIDLTTFLASFNKGFLAVSVPPTWWIAGR